MSGLVASWFTPVRWPWVAGLFAAALLAAAHAFQAAGYAPCALCLRQREVYWVVLLVVGTWAAAAIPTPYPRDPAFARLMAAVLAALFAVSATVAAFHAGVELKWWPGPASCATGGAEAVALDDLAGVLAGTTRVQAPACDEAPWVFAGLSMAGWNAALSLVMAALSVAVIVRSRPRA